MKYKHFCHVDPQEPNITLARLFITQRVQGSHVCSSRQSCEKFKTRKTWALCYLVNRTLTNRYSTQINDETKKYRFKIIIEYIKSQSLSVAYELSSLSQSLCLCPYYVITLLIIIFCNVIH